LLFGKFEGPPRAAKEFDCIVFGFRKIPIGKSVEFGKVAKKLLLLEVSIFGGIYAVLFAGFLS
jgi:hypothetical protein